MSDKDPFACQMRTLDALLDECRQHAPFVGNVVRDTSNRSNRDWPWWSVQVEQTDEDGRDTRRISATVRLNATQAGEPGSYEGVWIARVWQGVSADSFRAKGGWPLPWTQPSSQDLRDAMAALLEAGKAAIAEAR
ncbi:hypothetical protein TPR58_16970 [Sphingomonas sp. HF-S3]|uniref:Uncharacterized protein n=1 Tax=Sphingomonas rustica TaxID=3103142 RepID=A0ABV0BFL4_9SPHN